MIYIKQNSSTSNVASVLVVMENPGTRIRFFEDGFFRPCISYLSKSPGNRSMVKEDSCRPTIVKIGGDNPFPLLGNNSEDGGVKDDPKGSEKVVKGSDNTEKVATGVTEKE